MNEQANQYEVSIESVRAAAKARDIDTLRHLEFCAGQWATQAGQEATANVRKMIDDAIFTYQSADE